MEKWVQTDKEINTMMAWPYHEMEKKNARLIQDWILCAEVKAHAKVFTRLMSQIMYW